MRYAEGAADQDHITGWRRTFAFTSGKRSGRDWNFLTMQAPEGSQTTLDPVPGNAAAELDEFPGLFPNAGGAEQAMQSHLGRARLQEGHEPGRDAGPPPSRRAALLNASSAAATTGDSAERAGTTHRGE